MGRAQRPQSNAPRGIVHVINGLGKISGAERAMLRVALAQSTRPLAVVSLGTIDRSHPDVAALPPDIELIELGGARGLIGATLRLRALLARRPGTTVLCWMYRSNIAGALATFGLRRHRLIWNIRHSLSRLDAEPKRVRLSIWLNRALSRAPERIFYNSDRARHQHNDYGFPASKSVYVPNGFDPGPAPEPRAQTAEFVIGHAGRMSWEKDIDTLVAAFARARTAASRPLKLVLVGPGYDHSVAPFRELLARHGVDDGSVEARGRTDDMAGFYRGIDLFALSSVSEGFPNVLAEAQLAGRACVTTDVGDAGVIVGADFGWVVPPGDPNLLAQALAQAAAMDPAQLDAMGRAARAATVQRFAMDRIVALYDQMGDKPS